MPEFKVTCINKTNRFSLHEHITHIGNLQNLWRMTREAAIQRISSEQEQFYTVDRNSGRKMYIGVVREANKAPYLRTHADGKWNDNLLAQDDCTNDCKLIA